MGSHYLPVGITLTDIISQVLDVMKWMKKIQEGRAKWVRKDNDGHHSDTTGETMIHIASIIECLFW